MGIMIALLAAAALMMGGDKKKGPAPVRVDIPPDPRDTARAVATVEQEEEEERAPAQAPRPSAPPPPRNPAPVPALQTVKQQGGRYTVRTESGQPVPPNPAEAKRGAQAIADHVRNKKSAYSRPMLAVWQALAGIASDGLYGPGTAAALRANGAKNVVGPMFKG